MRNPEDMGPLSMHGNHSQPKPKSRALLWIFLCLIVVIGATLWFVRDMILQDTPKQSALPTEVMEDATTGNGVTQGTAQLVVGEDQALSDATKLPEQEGQMGILDMLDGGKKDGADGAELEGKDGVALDADGNPILDAEGNPILIDQVGQAQEDPEDAVVRAAFTEDLAPWLVSLYYPKGTHPAARNSGIVLADVSRINQRYGTQMTGLSWSGESIQEGRTSVLEYVFVPAMIDSLYALYANRFMDGIAIAASAPRANGNVLTNAQRKEMYTLYAQQMRSYAEALDGIVRMNNLSYSVDAWQLSTDKALEANADFTTKLFDYEVARDAGKTAEAATARTKMDAAGKKYQQAIIMRERARESLVESLRSSVNARRLDESSLLYLATWVKRRLQADPQNKDSLQSISLVLKDLATRFDEAKSAGAE